MSQANGVPDGFVLNLVKNYTFKRGDYFRYNKSGKWDIIQGLSGDNAARFYRDYPEFEIWIKPLEEIKIEVEKPAIKIEQIKDNNFKLIEGVEYFYKFSEPSAWQSLGSSYSGRTVKWLQKEHAGIIIGAGKSRFDCPRPYPFGY